MKLPRDISGAELARLLRKLGYQITRQSGSHLRLTTTELGQHHVTIPNMILSRWGHYPAFSAMWQRISKSSAVS